MHRFLAVLVLMSGCVDDGAPDAVDYITFRTPGTFRHQFLDIAFASGDVAFDVLADNPPRTWLIGTGSNLVAGTDADVAPYPNFMWPRKTDYGGRLDKRYWTSFAGGAWRSLGIRVESGLKLRASGSGPSIFPAVAFMWCPVDKGCVSWSSAVHDDSARCWRWDERGLAKRTDRLTCLGYHPRSHWVVDECDDCPIPAITRPP